MEQQGIEHHGGIAVRENISRSSVASKLSAQTFNYIVSPDMGSVLFAGKEAVS